jgi:hemerythrin-like metal-binding protein
MILPLNTGHTLMDSEHRTLLDWVQEGAQRLREARPTHETLYALDVLAHLARSHFEHEHVEMRTMGYADGGAHAQEHERLLDELSQLRRDVLEATDTGAWNAQKPLHQRLGDWMLWHISGHDRRYAHWLRQHGPKAERSSIPARTERRRQQVRG